MSRRTTDRRGFLVTTARAAGGLFVAPALVTQDSARPAITGVATGDISRDRAIVWSRTDRAATMFVEWSTTESFQKVRRVRGPLASQPTDFTARVDLRGLPADQRIFYRVGFDAASSSADDDSPLSTFLTAPSQPRDVTFAWSADTVGQGWGINLEWGGLRMYETIRLARPDFFVHCGDTIYADGPVAAEVKLPDGTTWRNLVTPAKSKVAETLDDFRGNYAYNLLDDNVRRFSREVPQLVLWDDHEVTNNWYPQKSLVSDERYGNKDMGVLAANARRAFLEYSPIRLPSGVSPPIYRSCAYGPLLEVFAIDLRTYRGPNSSNRQPAPGPATRHAGAQQLAWLKRGLRRSTARWKVIASDLPIGLIVPDGEGVFEGIANGEGGSPLGREHEIADLLRFIRQETIANIVWITGDVHYAAAHHYDPERAQFKEFRPFWEFVAGPLHAGTFGPNALDHTFGPEVRFSSVPAGMRPNRPPSEGLQFFGFVRIEAKTGVMTVDLRNLEGKTIYRADLEPER